VHNNFYVVKDKFTFIIFKPKINESISHVNITKISTFEKIYEAIYLAEELFQGEILLDTLKIDNITATYSFKQFIDLSNLYDTLHKEYTFQYNNDVFPGLHWKSVKGTAIIFHTGNINIVGCKSVEEIEHIIDQIKQWIQ